MSIPFFDMRAHLGSLRSELDAAYESVINSGWMILGNELEQFEAEFAAYCGAGYCIGVGTGLDALTLALQARGIGPGDEVIVPSHTFIATWFAVSATGAAPIPVEVEDSSCLIDPRAVEAAITARTAAIIPVHLYGHPANMSRLRSIAQRAGLFLLEDAAQSHGATWGNVSCGSLGDAAAFSFYPTKNLGALGDGGAIVTSDRQIAENVKKLRNYGSSVKYIHESIGVNSRLDELQAAFLRAKLRRLDASNDRRREIAGRYFERLASLESIRLPIVQSGARHVFHLFVVRCSNRSGLIRELDAAGVASQIHYPVPPHLQAAYSHLGLTKGAFPVAEALSEQVLSLPLWPEMTDQQVDAVCDALVAAGRQIA